MGFYTVLVGTVVFFGLTRTQTGREGLRNQLQSTFNDRFAGSLEIGSLEGNLLNDLTATNVTLRDEDGRTVATVDTLYARPHWRYLLTNTFPVRSVTLLRPQLKLHRSPSGRWNVQHALRPQGRPSGETPLALTSVDVTIRRGHVSTDRTGSAPSLVQDEWLLDYTTLEIGSVNAAGSFHWEGSDRSLNLDRLQATLPQQNLELRTAATRLVKQENRWSVEPFVADLGNTHLEAEGTVRPSPNDTSQWAVDIEVADSRLDHDELRRLIPRLPVRDVVTVNGRLGGTLDHLVFNHLTLAHEDSRVSLQGTARGLPEVLNVRAEVTSSQVSPTDVYRVWPHRTVADIEPFGLVQLQNELDASLRWDRESVPRIEMENTFSIQGAPGTIQGSMDLSRSASEVTYGGTVHVDTLNVAPFSKQIEVPTSLNGSFEIDGKGGPNRPLQSQLNVALSASRIGPQHLASATLEATHVGRSVRGKATMQQARGGTLALKGELDATGATPLFDGVASVGSFDLGGVHEGLPSTWLNASLTAEGRGSGWETFRGSFQLDVDSSHVERGDSTTVLPAHEVALSVSEATSDQPRLKLGGTLAAATVRGDVLNPALLSSGRIWRTAFHEALSEVVSPRPGAASDSIDTSPSFSTTRQAYAEALHGNLESDESIDVQGTLTVHRMDILHKWSPLFPTQGNGVKGQTSLTLSPDTLWAAGTVTAPSLRIDRRQIDSLDASFEIGSLLGESLMKTTTANVSVEADTVDVVQRMLVAPALQLQIDRRTGTLEASARGFGRIGPVQLESDVTLLEGHTHFNVRDLFVGAGQHSWAALDGGTVTAFARGLRIDSLNLESSRPLATSTQQIHLDGVLSSSASDSLRVEMTDVLLYPMAQLASSPHPVGGRVDGDISVSGGWSEPQVRSDFSVHRFSVDRRVLGTIDVQTRLAQQTSDLLVNARLSPSASSVDRLPEPNLVPNGPESLEENRLQISGRIGLSEDNPRRRADSSADQLDLNVNVDRADLFFFKYIFEDHLGEVQGYTAGTVHVGGRLRRPLFDAQLDIYDGEFTLPDYGLAYSAGGSVRVDEQGIHLQDLDVTDGSGSATVRGSILFNEYRYFSFDLAADLDELTVIDVADGEDLPFYGQIRASGPASLSGPLHDATLRSEEARTTPDSELFIPTSGGDVDDGTGFIVFADSTGQFPELDALTRRDNILSDRPVGEATFVEGLDIDINVLAPEESTVHLVFDPVVGDVVTAVGSGRIQIQRREGEVYTYGTFNISDGTYLFTAGEVFVRRFNITEGTITWDGPPTNAQLRIMAEYRTRASLDGLPGYQTQGSTSRIPVKVLLDIGGRVETPEVDLSLARIRNDRNNLIGSETLDAIFNQPDRTTEYATSVLLTNTFLLTTESVSQQDGTAAGGAGMGSLRDAGNQLAFNSVSQLVASQLNRYIGAALPNVDLNLGLQGEDTNELDVIYGVALRLLDERLVIRGEGVYSGDDPNTSQSETLEGEFVVEVRLNRRISVEAFYRRSGDEFTQGYTLTSSTGAGLSYQTEFSSWWELLDRVFGWLLPNSDAADEAPEPSTDPVARRGDETPDSNSDGSSE